MKYLIQVSKQAHINPKGVGYTAKGKTQLKIRDITSPNNLCWRAWDYSVAIEWKMLKLADEKLKLDFRSIIYFNYSSQNYDFIF